MIYYQTGSETTELSADEIKTAVFEALDQLGTREKVLAVPPDITRLHSGAGNITSYLYDYYHNSLTDVLPALGTHAPMTDDEIVKMFRGVPRHLFRDHDWRNDVVTVGTISSEKVSEITNGLVDTPWPAQLNKLVWHGGHDLIVSIGQVVPHEVIGMANYNKNLFVGTGGSEGINQSHFVGAAYGIENILGRAQNPVRDLLNYASENFIQNLPVVYIHTVVARNSAGKLVTRGLFIGDSVEVFTLAADLSLKVNFALLDKPLTKVIVYLDPEEFRTTWLGNKSVYRTRLAMADQGNLIVMAPGLKEFGEDKEIDRLIRKYGYRGTPYTLAALEENQDLKDNLSAAAHLIQASSEDRFTITYCPGHVTQQEIEGVNYAYADLSSMMQRYDPQVLSEGFNIMPDGEEIYYISNPATGLWAYKGRFNL
jgi:nickel-dependent lactate racemase